MNRLPQLVRGFVALTPQVRRVVLAVSGGLDSIALLHATVQAELELPLLAIHINHQLSPNANNWQDFVMRECASLGVELVCIKVEVNPAGVGVEEAARSARYAAIESQLQVGDLVLMAHHQLDQVETFFLRLARGAGVKGLAGMAALRPWGAATLGRPFIEVGREEIEQFARSLGLSWVEDESNASEKYDRNFLRLSILPNLQKRWPELPARVQQTSQLLRESDELLGEYAEQDLSSCSPRTERVGCSIEFKLLMCWSHARRRNLLRHWLTKQGYRLPSLKRLDEFESVLNARQDQSPLLNLGDCEIRRYRERIYCLPAHWDRAIFQEVQTVSTNKPYPLSDGSEIVWQAAQWGLPSGNYRIMPRYAASHIQRAHPKGRQHSQSLKKLLQEYALEPWLRERVPLVFDGERLVAVADLWVEHTAAVEQGLWPQWHYPSVI